MKRFLEILACLAIGTAAPLIVLETVTAKEVAESSAKQIKSSVKKIEWTDLTPPLSAGAQQAVVELNMRIDQMTDLEIMEAMDKVNAEGSALMTELDDTNVEIEGYLVPLDFDAKVLTDFVMVPYFGACLHVPAPPPNQTVFVKFNKGIALSDFEKTYYFPYKIRGNIKVARTQTELADVGYQLTASDVEVNEQE